VSSSSTFKHAASLALVLFGIWALWSGHYSMLMLTFGAVSCAAVLVLALKMDIVDQEGAPIDQMLGLVGYAPWLIWQIIRANVDVASRILRPTMPIHPTVFTVRTGQRRDIGRVIYANSITLTPGTVSIDCQGEDITVHALSREAADDVKSGEMDRRVTRFERAG